MIIEDDTIDKLYVCDGDADGCEKTYCKYVGTGDCMHTHQLRHARYKAPREWNKLPGNEKFPGGIYFEVVRDER